jgi:hypothetical protein
MLLELGAKPRWAQADELANESMRPVAFAEQAMRFYHALARHKGVKSFAGFAFEMLDETVARHEHFARDTLGG